MCFDDIAAVLGRAFGLELEGVPDFRVTFHRAACKQGRNNFRKP